MSYPAPSHDGVPTFLPCSPTIAAILVEVDGPHERRPTRWPVIGYEVMVTRDGPRYLAVVLDRDGEAHPLNTLVGRADPASGLVVRCVGFVGVGIGGRV